MSFVKRRPFFAVLIILVLSSVALHVLEGAGQPKQFGSLPLALWWAVTTLTSTGYGDAVPITPLGRIIASRSLSAMRKDVTGYLYGGDVSRKKKVLAKQAKGKKRLKKFGKVDIPAEAFTVMLKRD